MRYGFINNFSQTLAAELAQGATTMTLDGGGALLANASPDLVYTLTLDDGEGTVEIVHVTAASGNTLTITRGEEGTGDVQWPAGSRAELRVTAGVMSMSFDGFFDASVREVQIGGGAIESGETRSIAIGAFSYSASSDTVTVGRNATTWDRFCVAVGDSAESSGSDGVAVGRSAEASGQFFGAAFGSNAKARSTGATAVGPYATVDDDRASAFGNNARVWSGNGAMALGAYAFVDIPGCLHINALPYLKAEPADNAALTAPNATRRAVAQVAMATDPLDLTDDTAAVTLDLPAGVRLFVDTIDVVVVGADGAGGAPEVVVGPDDVTPAAYLAATAVTSTAVAGRESHPPLVPDGITSLRVATSTAGTGTTYQVKLVFHGYVMEL